MIVQQCQVSDTIVSFCRMLDKSLTSGEKISIAYRNRERQTCFSSKELPSSAKQLICK